jgi:hypothetical protein
LKDEEEIKEAVKEGVKLGQVDESDLSEFEEEAY